MAKERIFFDQDRLSSLMKNEGIDLLLAARRQNVAYLSGITSILYWEYPEVAHILEVQEDGCEKADYFVGVGSSRAIAPFAVVHNPRVPAWQHGWISDIQPWCYHSLKRSSAEAIINAVKARGLTKATLGIEMDYFPTAQLLELKKSLPKAKFKSADALLWRMRMIKSKRELTCQQKAYEIAGKIYRTLLKDLKPGMAVNEVRGLEMSLAITNNCPPLHFGYVIPVYNPKPLKDRRKGCLHSRDLIVCDLGLIFQGYTTDFGRMFSLGKPEARVKKAYKIILETRKVLEEAVRVGRKISEVYAEGKKYLAKYGVPPPLSLGHSIGLECHEPPSIVEYDHTVIAEGMTLVLELCPAIDDIWFLLEDAGVVTKYGWQSLTDFGVEIMEVHGSPFS